MVWGVIMLTGFEPIIDRDCEILILGSMPGEESLRKQQYYGYKRNHFWKIIFALFGQQQVDDYETKKAFLLQHHIALWDVIEQCNREGSSDSNIKNVVPNDFKTLFENYPKLKRVCFNGKKAHELYNRYVLQGVNEDRFIYIVLPSTSPANTTSFEQKLSEWKKVTDNRFTCNLLDGPNV